MNWQKFVEWVKRNSRALRVFSQILLAIGVGLFGNRVEKLFSEGEYLYGLIGSLFVLAIVVHAAADTGLLEKVIHDVKQLDERHRLRIRFVPADEPDAVHSQARDFLSKADIKGGCQIFGVNSYLEATSRFNSDSDAAIRRYYEKIESIAGSLAGTDGRYTRVVQLPPELEKEPYHTWVEKVKDHYKNHFQNVIEMRAKGTSVDLLRVKSRYHLSFLLIQNNAGSNYLIWQMDEQMPADEDGEARFRLHGIFLVEDPDRSITGHFSDVVHKLTTGCASV